MTDADGEIESVLIDIRQLPLGEIRSLGHPVLEQAVARVLDDARHPREVVAGFEAYMSPPDPRDGEAAVSSAGVGDL